MKNLLIPGLLLSAFLAVVPEAEAGHNDRYCDSGRYSRSYGHSHYSSHYYRPVTRHYVRPRVCYDYPVRRTYYDDRHRYSSRGRSGISFSFGF